MKDAFKEWLEYKDHGEESIAASNKVLAAIENMETTDEVLKQLCDRILRYKDYLVKKSIWAIGGDGWAYDIGYGCLLYTSVRKEAAISGSSYVPQISLL